MDVYDLSFFLSTMWVGPFWFAMLFYPEHAMTRKVMDRPLFFIGPIVIWWALMVSDPQVRVDFRKDWGNPGRIPGSLAEVVVTGAGAAGVWAHFLAGDIVVTRWMWKRCIEMNSSRWVSALSVFFGVMLMPVGVAMHLAAVRIDSKE